MAKKKIELFKVQGVSYNLDVHAGKVWEVGTSDKVIPRTLYGIPGFKDAYEARLSEVCNHENDDPEKKENPLEILYRDLIDMDAIHEDSEEGDVLWVVVQNEYVPITSYKSLTKAYLKRFGTPIPSLHCKGMDTALHTEAVGRIHPTKEPLPSSSPYVTARIDTSWVLELGDHTPRSVEVDELLSRMAPCSQRNLFALIIGCVFGLTIRNHHKAFLLWGKGGEGKSALNDAIRSVFAVRKSGGKTSHSIDSFKGAHTAAYVAGKTYVFIEEEPVSQHSLQFIRKLSGDMMGNRKNKDIVTFTPVCNVTHITNYRLTSALLKESEGRANLRRICPILLAPRSSTEEDAGYVARLSAGIPYLTKLALEYMASMKVTPETVQSKFPTLVQTVEGEEVLAELTRLGGIISSEYNFYNDFLPVDSVKKEKRDPDATDVYEKVNLERYFRDKISMMNEYFSNHQAISNITDSVVKGMIECSTQYLKDIGYSYNNEKNITHVFGFSQRMKKNQKHKVEACEKGEWKSHLTPLDDRAMELHRRPVTSVVHREDPTAPLQAIPEIVPISNEETVSEEPSEEFDL